MNQGKYIWHMSTYESASGGTNTTQKNIYCLKAGYGASWESFNNSSSILEYNLFFDLQEEREELSKKIVDNGNDADEVLQDLLNENGTQYREILWLLDNMYIKGETDKEEFLYRIGVTKDVYEGVTNYYNYKNGNDYGEEILTESDIIAIQRVAIWTFTNGGDFDKTENTHWLRTTTDASDYEQLNSYKDTMAVDLYNYLVSSAKTGASLYTADNNYTISDAPTEVNLTGLTQENGKYKITTEINDSDYLIGPIILDKNNDMLFKISMTVKNENGTEIDSSKYTFVDANGSSLGSVTLKDLVGKTEGFYIKLDRELGTKFDVQIQVVHYNTTKNLWLQGTESTEQVTLNAEQPIAELSREEEITIIEFVAEPELIEVSVTKDWEDSENQDGIRPDYVTVQLLANGLEVEGETVTLSESNQWTETFTELPKILSGVEVAYTVAENPVPTDYTVETSGDAETIFTITNSYTPQVKDIEITKVWDDGDNQDGTRPSTVEIILYADGVEEDRKEVTGTGNTWTGKFTNLPVKKAGKDIVYTIDEAEVTGYEKTVNGFEITNKYTPATRDIEITKVWDDGDNQDGTRPSTVEIILYADGVEEDRKEVTGTGNTWTGKFTNLPVKKAGKDIVYTIDEAEVTGYEKTVNGFEITNSYTPGTTSVKVIKVWDDSDNQDDLRTDSVTVKLLKDGEEYKSIELSDSNNWQYTFTGLPKKENGEDITYTVDEITKIEGYTTTVEEKKVTTESAQVRVAAEPEYIITNTHELEKIFDLALRKYITKVNGTNVADTRVPDIDESTLQTGITATYKHRKDPVQVKTGDIVTYSITIYNEGKKAGYASQIVDQLPTGLKYKSGDTVTSNKNTYNVTYNETTNKIIFDIANSTEDEPQELQAYTTGNLDSETIEIECEVIANASKEGSQILTNVAWISEAYDVEDDKSITTTEGDDRDSEPGTIPNVGKDNMEEYKGNDSNNEDLTDNTYYYKGEQDDDDFEKVIIPAEEKEFDLALRKYIIKINNNELTTLGLSSRVPNISEATLQTGTTATYKHRKDPVEVEENDIVTYAITIYNEGEKAGYASQIIDQLPEGLIFNPSTEVTSNKNTYKVTYEASTNKVTFDIVNTTENPARELQPYEEGNLDSETIEIKCKVIYRAKAGKSQILTNVAWINEAFDVEDNKTITTAVGEDRDSEPGTKPNVNKDNMEEYKGDTSNKDNLGDSTYYYKGEQDDDDFEKVYVKAFDLNLRKFISSVNGKETENSREPVVDVTPLQNGETTAIYTHTKTPLALKVSDTVIYTIRIYNEGEIPGYASEVKDYLPPYLEYVENSALNKKYGWTISNDGRLATTTYLLNKEIDAFNGTELDYEDLQIECKISENAIPNERITNIAEISEYKYGDTVYPEDRDSESYNIAENLPEDKQLPEYKKEQESDSYVPGNEDDDDFEKVYVKEFDLALRKFITQVQDEEITTRVPQVKYENGVISYEHTKDALTVHVGDVVIYTIRVYNEGEIPGYASEITDDIPEYLEYLPEDSTNVKYMWKMYDENGNETENVEDAVKVKTQYLSKENEENNLIEKFDGNTLYYRDIKVAFKVKDPNSNNHIITNCAQISNDTDEDEKEITDKDSITDKWNDDEDDQDIENIKVEYFDLSILKFVSKVIVIEDGKETITETGYNGHENPEPVVKVELHKKKLNNVVVKFGYGITVTNEGDVPGYATEITDYVPEGLKFVDTDNPDWTDEGNNVVSTRQLENTLLQPGESETIEVILTWINGSENLAQKTNIVEISEDKNEFNVSDRDSVIDNKQDGEDDIDIAKVVLAVATGRTQTYFTLTLGLLAIIAIGVILIKKFVI